MSIFKFFKQLFLRNKSVSKTVDVIDLRKWDFLCQADDESRTTLILEISKTKTNMDAKLLADALSYSDDETRNKWIKASKLTWPSFAINLIVNLKKPNTISKLQSDRLKAYLTNNFAHIEKWTNRKEFEAWKASGPMPDAGSQTTKGRATSTKR